MDTATSAPISPSIRQNLAHGFRDGIPIGLGYLAVSFSLGISAKNAGLTAFQSFLISAFCNASAGEYAGFTSIGRQRRLLGAGAGNVYHQRPISADELRHEPANQARVFLWGIGS